MQEKYFAIYSKTAFWMLYLCSAIWKNRCRGGKNMPTIHFRLLQGLQKRHRDSVQTFAGIAMRQTGFTADNCRVCIQRISKGAPTCDADAPCSYASQEGLSI